VAARKTDFILFTHYYLNEDADYASYLEGGYDSFSGVDYLSRFLGGLRDLLCGKKKGLLVLFYSHGWTRALSQLQRGGFLDKDAEKAIDFSNIFAQVVRARLHDRRFAGLADRLRIVTAKDLLNFFSGTRWDIAKNLDEWLVGESVKMTYDSPKLVDAVIRLRAMDSGIPVFRIDQDVLFNDWTESQIALGLSEAVARSIQVHRDLHGDPRIGHAMFSCRYRVSSTLGDSIGGFDEWSTAFATQVYPALRAREVRKGQAPHTAFDRTLAQRFFGIDNSHRLRETGVWRIGAHPLQAVVSGGLLYLSPGAILDLPPFSNFKLRVMWVDDHLKYLLHRTLRHFMHLPEDPWGKWRPEVHKGRQSTRASVDYVFGEYIPTVFWGSILEAWIQRNPNVKLTRAEIEQVFGQGSTPPKGDPGPLAESIQSALRTGYLERRDRADLYRHLCETATKRIQEIFNEWSSLTDDAGRPSCACEWVRGRASAKRQTRLADGLLKKGRAFPDASQGFEQFNDGVREGLDRMILQAMSYIDWTLSWPNVVQTIRSLPPGAFVGDIEYERRD
jgi:hypothetical protein